MTPIVALVVRNRRLDLLEGGLVDDHPQRHENCADALLSLAFFDFQIGDDLRNEIHGGEKLVG